MDVKGKGKERQEDISQSPDGNGVNLEQLYEKLVRGETVSNCIAWYPSSSLIAVPAGAAARSSTSPALLLSYPSSNGTSFTLDLPPRSSSTLPSHQEYVSYTSFSPNGELLLVTSQQNVPSAFLDTTIGTQQERPSSIRLVIYQATEHLNRWNCILDWDSARARPTGPEVSKVVHLRWFGDTSSTAGKKSDVIGKKRKRDVLGDHGGTSFLAVLDTHECLLFHMRPDGTTSIFITSLETSSTNSLDLCFAGLSLPPTIDALGNIIPSQPLASSSTTSHNQSGRLIRHAAISSSEPVEDATNSSRVLVAYKGDKIPKFYVPQDSNPAGSMVEQLTGLPDPLNPATLGGSTGMSDLTTDYNSMDSAGDGSLQLPGMIIPSSSASLPLAGTTSTVTDGGINNISSTDGTNHFYQDNNNDPYAEINMSALDDLLEFNFGASTAGTAGGAGNPSSGATTDFDAFMSGAELNSSTSSALGSSLVLPTTIGMGNDTQNQDSQIAGKNGQPDSPAKSTIDGGSSPRKMNTANGNGMGNEGGLEGMASQVPERLENQLAVDREEGMVQLWEVVVQWDALSVSSKRIQGVSPYDPLDDPTTSSALSASTEITSLKFLAPGSFRSSASAHLLWATTASLPAPPTSPESPKEQEKTSLSTFQQGWNISRQPFELSDAFSNLEGKKNPPPSPEDPVLGHEWVVVGGIKGPETGEGTLVLDQVQAGDGRLYTLSFRVEGGFKLVGQDTSGSEDAQSAAISIPSTEPLCIVLSSNGTLALACAFDASDDSRMVGQPRIFPLPLPSGTKVEEDARRDDVKMEEDKPVQTALEQGSIDVLGRAVAYCLLRKQSSVDLLIQLSGKPANTKQAVIRAAWSSAAQLLHGLPVAKSRLLLPMLALQSKLFPDGDIANDVIHLAAMQRLLQSSMSTLRQSVQPLAQGQGQTASLEIFDTSAIWPIVGHIGWLFNKWDDILLNMTSDSPESNPLSAAFLVLHTSPRMIQQRLIRLIARFANFIISPKDSQSTYLYSNTGSLDIEVARGVLGDLIVSNRAKTQEWSNMLQRLHGEMGEKWQGDSEAAREALITLRLPDQLEELTKQTVDGMREKLLPLVGTKSGKNRRQYDVITRAVLTKEKRTKRCTVCDGRAAIPVEQMGEWELARRRQCICGGLWVAE